VGALARFYSRGLGHGGACLLVGGKPTLLTSDEFCMDDRGFRLGSQSGCRGGTICNLLAGGLAVVLLRRRRLRPRLTIFLGCRCINLYVGRATSCTQGRAYMRLGKLIVVCTTWLLRGLLILSGDEHFLCVRMMLAQGAPLTGGDPAVRYRRAIFSC